MIVSLFPSARYLIFSNLSTTLRGCAFAIGESWPCGLIDLIPSSVDQGRARAWEKHDMQAYGMQYWSELSDIGAAEGDLGSIETRFVDRIRFYPN
jgi:hypothetical protein